MIIIKQQINNNNPTSEIAIPGWDWRSKIWLTRRTINITGKRKLIEKQSFLRQEIDHSIHHGIKQNSGFQTQERMLLLKKKKKIAIIIAKMDYSKKTKSVNICLPDNTRKTKQLNVQFNESKSNLTITEPRLQSQPPIRKKR